jgi:hypothetical protein
MSSKELRRVLKTAKAELTRRTIERRLFVNFRRLEVFTRVLEGMPFRPLAKHYKVSDSCIRHDYEFIARAIGAGGIPIDDLMPNRPFYVKRATELCNDFAKKLHRYTK